MKCRCVAWTGLALCVWLMAWGCTLRQAVQSTQLEAGRLDSNPLVRAVIPEQPGQADLLEPGPIKPEVKKKSEPPSNIKYIAPSEQKADKAKTAASAPGKEPPVHVELAFDNADLYEVLDLTLYDLYGLSYIVDPALKAMVSFHIRGDYTRDEFINVMNNVLQMNNLAIVKGAGNIYKIVQRQVSAGAGQAGLTFDDSAEMSGDVTRLVRLKYLAAAAAVANVTPFLSKGATIVPNEVHNSLIITDTAENIRKVTTLLGALDVDFLTDVSWQLFPLKEVDATTVATDLGSILKTNGLYTRQGAVQGSFEVIPITSMNAILVLTRWPSLLSLVQEWVTAMDQVTDSDTNVWVYFVENGTAVELADVLQQIFQGSSSVSRSSASTSRTSRNSRTATGRSSLTGSSTSSPQTSAAGGLSASGRTTSQQRANTPATGTRQTLVRSRAAGAGGTVEDLVDYVEIIPDEVNNAIIFKANNRDYKVVQNVLKQLDIVPRQVLINVLIAEISLTGSVKYGVEWFLNKNIGKLGGSDKGEYTIQGALDSQIKNPYATPLGTSQGFFFSIYDPVEFLRGLVYAIGSDSNVNILSSPNILALDNREAVIEVGNDIPTATSTTSDLTTGSKVTSTVQYRKTGVLLTVTPHINSNGRIKMELIQEVSEIGDFIKELSNYIILTRRAETSLVVNDGQTVVIGGLMKSNNRKSNAGIPFLKDIPILGYLFGAGTEGVEKTELIIMITPRVIKSKGEADLITREFSEKIRSFRGLDKAQQPYVHETGNAVKPDSGGNIPQ